MALNFGSSLFRGDPEDSLKARWQQSGSELVQASGGDSGTWTLRTVTSGRTLYVDTVIIAFNADADVDIKDNAGVVASVHGATDTTLAFYFASPLKFTHSMVITVSSGSVNASMTGWEE